MGTASGDSLYRLRAARTSDYAFLFDLHRRSLGGSKPDFDERFDPEQTQIITLNGVDIGELSVEDREEELVLARISILPEYQRRGIGTAVVWSLLEKAEERDIPVRLTAPKANPARRLLERLGFVVTGEDGERVFLCAAPGEGSAVKGRVRVAVCRLEGSADLPLPAYQSEGAVGMDLCAAVSEELVLEPGKIGTLPCGFAVAIPTGYEAQIRPRSGLALRGITVVNAPGTIDSDYRGEVKVLLINLGTEALRVTRGMRIAQMLVLPVPRVEWQEVTELPSTARGEGGFGHTGV